MQVLVYIVGFLFITLAARQIGQAFSYFRLPLISGYLLAGIVAGPFVLDFVSIEAVENLRVLDEISLAFIAFAAGSELYLDEMRSRFRSILWHTAGQLVLVFGLGVGAMLILAPMLPFVSEHPGPVGLAVALLTGAILVARSPSSAIAIVNELRAKGPFTKTVLGVTILMDVVVVTLFAVTTSVVDLILTGERFNLLFVLILVAELALSVGLGYAVGRGLRFILHTRFNRVIKIVLLLAVGFAVFDLSAIVRDFSPQVLPFEILLEPLLICMVGSFVVTNYSPYRTEFLDIIDEAGPVIYLIFFTLVGESLRLDILAQTILITLVIFGVRLVGLFLGSLAGGMIAGDPMRQNRVAWMAYVTQAGIGLGLAKEAAVEFPELGDEFATLVISVIVLSQLVGPPMLNWVIRRMGESRLPPEPEPDTVRDVLILGVGGQAQALARQLQAVNWQVTIADTDAAQLERCRQDGIHTALIPDISLKSLNGLVTRATDAIVAMLDNDADNYRACELAYTHFGIPRRIVRLNDYAWADRFTELDALVVYPTSAVVNLLAQFVRAPQSAALLLQQDPASKTVQVTVTDPDVSGLLLRDLRLPGDVLVLGITRDGTSIVPHGHTRLRLNDEVVLIGAPERLAEVTLRLGY